MINSLRNRAQAIYHRLARYRLFWLLVMVVPPVFFATALRFFPLETLGTLLTVLFIILAVVSWKICGFMTEEFKEK